MRSLSAKPLQHRLERDGPAAFALGDRLEKHPLGFLVRLEGFVVFRQENRNGRSFGKLRTQQFDAPIDHTT